MLKIFPLLALETTGDLCSVAVFSNAEQYSEFNVNKKQIHSEKLLECIESCCSTLNYSVSDLNSIAISMGPGSFTGLRIGLSVAKGIAFGKNLPIIPVDTFSALAFYLTKQHKPNETIVIANKVNIDELYFAKYLATSDGYKIIHKLDVIDADQLEQHTSLNDIIYSDKKKVGKLSNSTALIVGRWALNFGKDLLTYEYDYLEPNYLKNFKIRRN